MAENQAARRILVGVTYGQPDVVLRQAARFARTFQAALVCAHVDPGRYVVEELPDGSVASLPLDPDLPELKDTDFDQGLVAQVRAAVADESVELSFRELAGDVAYALTRLADILDVEMIIVGSRRGGVRAGLKQFLTGSVAAHLAHRQPRPVVVVPVAPVAEGKPLPWEE
ncbi:MAG TPA: universal stress protein [Propionibacteriaceae bacterium]|jgi:nucleotide-binding universal stress UspA family protein|nr:universal stress protein [Propionibacteriaceae bacterium]